MIETLILIILNSNNINNRIPIKKKQSTFAFMIITAMKLCIITVFLGYYDTEINHNNNIFSSQLYFS